MTLQDRVVMMPHWVDDLMAQGILSTDTDLTIRSWNRWLEIHSGYSAAQVLGRNLLEVYPDLVVRHLDTTYRQALENHVVVLAQRLHQYLLPMPTGEDQSGFSWMQQSARIGPLLDGDQVIGTITLIDDVTERVAREDELRWLLAQEREARASAEMAIARVRHLQAVTDIALAHLALEDLLRELLSRIHAILQADTAAILLLDATGTSLRVHAMIGLDEVRVRELSIPLGEGFAGRVAVERRPVVLDDLNTIEIFSPFLRERGVRSLLGVPLLIKDQVIGVVHVGTLQSRSFTDEDVGLLQLVAERAAIAIGQARLYEAERQARAEAELALRVRDELFAVVSHDLKNPLGVIRGYVQLLQQRLIGASFPGSERIDQGLLKIDAAVTRMLKMIEGLLDTARLRAGQPLDLQCGPVELVLLASRIATEHQQLTDHHHIHVDTCEQSLIGQWDSVQLERVVGNLLSNAMKYSPQGGDITLSIRRELDADRAWAVLAVRDQGIGIPAADLPQIFKRFHRAGNTSGHIQGNGLGLASARQIVEQHSGTITVVSEEGRGTTVTVRLPLIR